MRASPVIARKRRKTWVDVTAIALPRPAEVASSSATTATAQWWEATGIPPVAGQ